jgi:PDDEXK-like domain of unknown function (DUF3799)
MLTVRPYIKGQPITEAGVYSGVPMATYHGPNLCDAPSISSSGLRKIFNMSPAHYWAFSPYNPDRAEEADTEAFIIGRAAHHLLLGEDDFSTLFIVRPDKAPDGRDWNGNNLTCKKWLADQALEGRTVLTAAQIEIIRGMARSLAAHPLIEAGILNGLIEHTIVWRDKDTGVWLKARPDAIPNFDGDFGDLKTTVSVQTDDLIRTLADTGYHQQAALLGSGWHALTGRDITSFSLIFVEKKPPYCTRVVTLRDEDLARGERQNFIATKTFKQCMETGNWPGPGNADAEYLSLPTWQQNRIDRQLELAEAQ